MFVVECATGPFLSEAILLFSFDGIVPLTYRAGAATVPCSSLRSSKDYLLTIQWYYRRKSKLNCSSGLWQPLYDKISDYLTGEYGSQYKLVGCYKMKTKIFGPMLTKLALNNNNRRLSAVAECVRVAWEQARRVFG